MTIKVIRPLDNDVSSKLISGEGFLYAHLIKFEKPIKTVTGAVSENARDYSYLTDASFNIQFDDESQDSLGADNGTQTYVAQRLDRVGQVAETIQAKATSMTVKIDSIALNTTLAPASTTINISTNLITIGESWIDAGFTEGDKLRISSNDGNDGKFIIINSFESDGTAGREGDNRVIGATLETGVVNATNNATYIFTIETEEHTSPFMDKDSASYAHYINREVFVYKALIDQSTGTVIGMNSSTKRGGPFLIFKGIIAAVDVREDPNKNSSVNWKLTSHWGDFVKINGRLTSDTEHRGINGQGQTDYAALIRPEYINDYGFMHSEQALNLIVTYKATETKYKFKKTGILGLGSGKTIEYEVEVDRELELRMNLDARRLPVIYGVNRIDSFPIFVDLDRNVTSEVYVAYALCEGEVAGLYDIYLDNKSRICADANDSASRGGSSDAVSVICEGRKDKGDTLSSKDLQAASASGSVIAGPYGSITLGGVNFMSGPREQMYFDPVTGWEPITGNANITAPATGIRHEKGHHFNTPINGRIIFHRGTPSQDADNMLVAKAAETTTNGGFLLQHQYFSDNNRSNYWGPNHRLLDTAYVVAKYQITEEDLEIPELEFVVRGRILDCHNYDYSYRNDPDASLTSASFSSFNLGDTVTLHKTSDNSQIGSSNVIADFSTYYDEDYSEDGDQHYVMRFQNDPVLGDTTKFYALVGSDKWYMVTHDHQSLSGTVATELHVGVSSFAAQSPSTNGVNIVLANESGHGAFVASVIDYTKEVSPIAATTAPDEVRAKMHFATFVADSVNTGTRTLQQVSDFTDGWNTTDIPSVRVPRAIVLESGNTTLNYYQGEYVELSRTKSDGTIKKQKRLIIGSKQIGSKVVAMLDRDWDVDADSDFTLEPKTFSGVTGRTADTFKVLAKGDQRVSINPAMQLLDYITNKRYGKGLSLEKDIDLDSFKTVARLCDTRSDITVIFQATGGDAASFTVGTSYKYPASGTVLWQGKVKSTEDVTYNSTTYRQVVFTDCIGKLAHRWFDYKYYDANMVLYDKSKGRAWINGSNGTTTVPNSFLDNTELVLTRVGSGGTASPKVWLGTFSGEGDAATGSITFDGNPVIKSTLSGVVGFGTTGYSLYDSDDVKYWRYLGWQSQNQREVTRHQCCPVLDTNTSVFENINTLLAHFNGILRYSNGKYELDIQSAATLDGYTANDVRIIREDDLIGTISVQDDGQKGSKNTVSVNFPDPQQEYGNRAVTYFNSTYLAEDRNIPKKHDIKTPHILNYFNARINAKQYLDQSRYGKKINFIMEPKGNLLLAGTIVQMYYPRFGWGSDDLVVQQFSGQTTTTFVPHGFKVGDIVRYEDITNTSESMNSEYNNKYFTISAVPSTTTFTTDQPSISTYSANNLGKVYKKGDYYRITNINFREDCSVQVTAMEHNDESFLISKRKSDVVGLVESPNVGVEDNPPAPTALAASAVDEAKAIKVRWTNNAEAYKTQGGVTTWKKAWFTEIWINNQASFTATDNSSHNQKFAGGAVLLERLQDKVDYIYTPEGAGTQTRYHWVRHVKEFVPVGGSPNNVIELASDFYPASNADGVSASATGTVPNKTIEIVPVNGVVVTYEGPNRILPVDGSGNTLNLAFKIKLNNFDTSKKWYYRYYTTTGNYILSGNGTASSNSNDNQYKGVHHWSGSSNSQSFDEFTLHPNFEPKSPANSSLYSVVLNVQVFELDDTNGITNSDTPIIEDNIALSAVNIGRPNYQVSFSNATHTFIAEADGTADVTGFSCLPTIFRNSGKGLVELTYAPYTSSVGDDTFSYGDDSSHTANQSSGSLDGITTTNCNAINAANGTITINSNSSIATSDLTVSEATIRVQIKDNKAIKDGLAAGECDIKTEVYHLSKVPNPVREGTTIVVDVGDSGTDQITVDVYNDFVASGNLSTVNAQACAAYVMDQTIDDHIRPNDILTITNGNAAQASRIFTGTGTASSSSVGAGNWSSKVVQKFDGSVIVDGTLSADKITANTTFTNNLNVASILKVGDGTNAGQIQSPNKSSYTDNDNGFFLGSDGSVYIGNATHHLKYDGANGFQVAGSLSVAGPAGNVGASTANIYARAASAPTKPSNSYTTVAAAVAAANAAISGSNPWSSTIPNGTAQLWVSAGSRAEHASADDSSTYWFWQDPIEFEGPAGADSTVAGPAGPSGPGMFRIDSGNNNTPAATDITATKIDDAINRTYAIEGDVCIVVNQSGVTRAFTCTTTTTSNTYNTSVWAAATAFIGGDLIVNGGITGNKLSIVSTGAGDSGIFMDSTGGAATIKVKEYSTINGTTAQRDRVIIGYLG